MPGKRPWKTPLFSNPSSEWLCFKDYTSAWHPTDFPAQAGPAGFSQWQLFLCTDRPWASREPSPQTPAKAHKRLLAQLSPPPTPTPTWLSRTSAGSWGTRAIIHDCLTHTSLLSTHLFSGLIWSRQLSSGKPQQNNEKDCGLAMTSPHPAWQLHSNGLSRITCLLKPYHPVGGHCIVSTQTTTPQSPPTSLSGIQGQGGSVSFASLAVLGTQQVPNESSVTMRVCIISPRLLADVLSGQAGPEQDHFDAKRDRFHQPLCLGIFRKLLPPSCFCQIAQGCLWSAGSEPELD